MCFGNLVGFDFNKSSIDMNQVRLCFQVYLRDSLESSEIVRDPYHILRPIVSNVICNSQRKTALQILHTSNFSSPCSGGGEVIVILKRFEDDQRKLFAVFYDDDEWFDIIAITEDQILNQVCFLFLLTFIWK